MSDEPRLIETNNYIGPDRRSYDRRARKAPLSCAFKEDHWLFAALLVLVFVVVEYTLNFHWASKPLEVIIGAGAHRALFGGK